MQADKEKITQLLKIARGQLDSVLKMVDENRYCVDISNQLLAIIAILRNANRDILNAHLESCVHSAFGNDDAKQKITEIIQIMDKLTK